MSGKILCVVGARPNFMKIAPIMSAFHKRSDVLQARLVHTGQHYDVAMNQQFFEQLAIPHPDIDLEVGSASHAIQTAEIMRRFEPVLESEQPQAILVVGDVNSTIACALVAAKKNTAVIHVEAGLRSFDRRMPEEINRVLTDQIADLLFTTERNALKNLTAEGIAADKVHFVGNVMIDTLLASLKQAVPATETLASASAGAAFLNSAQGYGVVTLHRPSNVDDPDVLQRLLQVLRDVSSDMPLVFPVHPRTESMINKTGFANLLETANILRLKPLGYLEMLGLVSKARMVLTDSGGLQEETTALGIPCITMRENTERPITIEQGTNTLVGSEPDAIRSAVQEIFTTGGKAGRVPELWDGHAAQRIADILASWSHQFTE